MLFVDKNQIKLHIIMLIIVIPEALSKDMSLALSYSESILSSKELLPDLLIIVHALTIRMEHY